MSTDLDFVTTERSKRIAPVVERLGFVPRGREFEHPESRFFIEFPSGPLAFGDRYVDNDEATTVQTQYGAVRIITPTQSVMDRIAWFHHGADRQSRDQAIMVARRQNIAWDQVFDWAQADGIELFIVQQIKDAASDSA